MDPLIGNSPAMREVLRRIGRAAEVESPVLIWGEPGSGKKLVAETIHRQSGRREGLLVTVPTEKSSEPLLEADLFGPSGQRGAIAKAAGGTLLIEEITALPRTCQARLLAAVERRRSAAPADHDDGDLDFRLMATSRYEPLESVERGAVREDLYYRLSVLTIPIPPLRERKEDIPPLIRHCLADVCTAGGRPVPSVDADLMRVLIEHPWPGNVHQLHDCLKAMVAVSDAEILSRDDLPSSATGNGRDVGLFPGEQLDTLADLEHVAVMRALKASQGNRTRAARSLGISVRTLQRKLKHWKAR